MNFRSDQRNIFFNNLEIIQIFQPKKFATGFMLVFQLFFLCSISFADETISEKLHSLIMLGDHDGVEKMIQDGARVDYTTPEGGGPLELALFLFIESGNLDIIKLLLAQPELRPNQTSKATTNGVFSIGVLSNNLELVEMLLADPRIDIQPQVGTDLHAHFFDASNGNLSLLSTILSDSRFDVNAKSKEGLTVLDLASISGNLDTVEFILNHPEFKVPKLRSGSSSNFLLLAASAGSVDVLKKYIDDPRFSEPRLGKDDPLDLEVRVAGDGHPATIRFFLEKRNLDFLKIIESRGVSLAELAFHSDNSAFFEIILQSNRPHSEKFELVSRFSERLNQRVADLPPPRFDEFEDENNFDAKKQFNLRALKETFDEFLDSSNQPLVPSSWE